MINCKKINEIKKAHKIHIINFRYYFDKRNKRDLLLSVAFNNNIKLWNIKNFECLLNMQNINATGELFSSCFLNDKNNTYIVSSNYNINGNCDAIKIFDFEGNKIKEINDSNEKTFFIDNYYDIKLSKNYIITGNYGFVKSYDFHENKAYHKYYDNDNGYHTSIIINNYEEIIKLIESSENGYIRIWNFHSRELLNKIKINNQCLNGICLWNHDHLFIGCGDKRIKLLDLKSEKVIKDLIGHNNEVLTLKKIINPQIGNILISQGWHEDKIKLWLNKS